MCYEFEREYWLRRAEEIRREMLKAEEERRRQAQPAVPAKAAPGEEERTQPVPA